MTAAKADGAELTAADPIVCVLRHEGQLIHRTEWGGSLYLVHDEWHVYLPEDGGDPTMHAVLDDAVRRLTDAAFAAGREAARLGPTDNEMSAIQDNQAERMAEMTDEERNSYGDL